MTRTDLVDAALDVLATREAWEGDLPAAERIADRILLKLREELLRPVQGRLPDPCKLDVLAQWFDLHDVSTESGVQDDLRRWARGADEAATLLGEVLG